MKYLNLTFLLIISAGCSMFERRDFEYQMSEYNFADPMFVANRDFMPVAGDSGRGHRSKSELNERTPATEDQLLSQRYDRSLQRELQNLEMQVSEAEYEQFSRYRDQIGGASQQIYFLRLSPRSKRAYLESRGITKQRQISNLSYGNNYRNPAFFSVPNDVTLGMSKDQVIQSWGKPVRRETSGSIAEGNERWAFRRGDKMKYIYFESGQVQGWTEQ